MKWNLSTDNDALLLPGMQQLYKILGIECAGDGVTVQAQKGDQLRVFEKDGTWHITYSRHVEFYRAAALALRCMQTGQSAEETARFESCGLMLDASRNAVPTVESVKDILRRMALMGLNLAMLYTEDTYEVPDQPYFGYLRGRYTFEELREIDDCAASLGIEAIPCVQTLAHLERVLQWPVMEKHKDANDVLLVGEKEPETYELIRTWLKAASAPFRSKRVHIGMDEAYWLGRGQYRNRYGFATTTELMRVHLEKVSAILRELGLEAMMWSDMHFSAARDEGVYHPEAELTKEILDGAPDDIGLVFWDYYHETNNAYDNMLKKHAQFRAPTIFAGGIWTWLGPAADYRKTMVTTLPALEECVRHGVKEVFATAWMDDGAECNPMAMLYGLQLFAEYCYCGKWDEEELAARFKITCEADAKAFLEMSRFNELPGEVLQDQSTANFCKELLYEDPMLLMFEKDLTNNSEYVVYYEKLAAEFDTFAKENPRYAPMLNALSAMAKALVLRCRWREEAPKAVRAGNRAKAGELTALAKECADAVNEVRKAWRAQWDAVNKPFGFEVLDIRLGGVMARFETAAQRMQQYADGTLEELPEFMCEKLTYLKDKEGRAVCRNLWSSYVSACCVGKLV